MKCTNCGKEVNESVTFCPECGQRLKEGFTPEERQKYIEKLETSIEEEKPAKKTKMKKKLLIGLASVIGIFILIGIIAIVTAPEEQPTQILPPAETTEPVSPPTTPEKPALTIAEQAYVNAVGDQATTVGKALTNLSSLLQNPKYGNDEWTFQVAAQLVTIRMVYDEAMELDPPSSMAEIHLKYTQGMKAYNDMTYLFSRGVDELDPNLIDQAVTKMKTGIQLINEATELMLEFSETHK